MKLLLASRGGTAKTWNGADGSAFDNNFVD
jgi:hypothetical protein